MGIELRKVASMSVPWQDFFRPDLSSSNRSLKRYLGEEGLEFGHRDLVLLRRLAERRIYLSYAALEEWSEGELDSDWLDRLSESTETDLDEVDGGSQYQAHRLEDGTLLVGIEGEFAWDASNGSSPSEGLVVHQDSESATSPLIAIYGGGILSSHPGAGGMWSETELQQASVTLLDGESSQELIEAFRYLFRAAPTGQARASVAATALSRHHSELDLEVAQKLEELSPVFGQALRQLFTAEIEQGCRALDFLLENEQDPNPPKWCIFWRNIRPTILQSLTRDDRGCHILIRSVDRLAASSSGDQLLNHHLLDAFLLHLDTLTPQQQDKLIDLIVEWTAHSPEATGLLQSRLKLTVDKGARLLLGESLRQTLVSQGKDTELAQLAQLFVTEAISAGSTARSIALSELLRSFGSLVLKDTAASSGFEKLTERQTLNVIDIWEIMLNHQPDLVGRVAELYVRALESSTEHLSLWLRSTLLGNPHVYEQFCNWLKGCDEEGCSRILAVGYSWSLSVENRSRLASALATVKWGFAELWESEWRRPHLSYQRLGWLAECARKEQIEFSDILSERLDEILSTPPVHPYFWHLMKLLMSFPALPDEWRERVQKVAYETFQAIEPTQEEERDALFEVTAATVRYHHHPQEMMQRWAEGFEKGAPTLVWWLAGSCNCLYEASKEGPEPTRALVRGIIQRLLSDEDRTMADLLAQALEADADDELDESTGSLPLEVLNLCYEALATIASHSACPAALQATIRRRLALFLLSWGEELKKTSDAYAFRETPLFQIADGLLDDPDTRIQELLSEIAVSFLNIHRQVPEKFRLEVRHAAQLFFKRWSAANPKRAEAESWQRALVF